MKRVAIKKWLSMCSIVLIILLLLSGCAKSGVSQEQLENDIASLPELQSCFESDYVSHSNYTLKKCVVTKEQFNPDKKEDIIFCDVEVENDYFSVNLSFETRFVYFDKGGWKLDSYNFERTDCFATKEPDIDKLAELIFSSASTYDGYNRTPIRYEYNGERNVIYGNALKVESVTLNDDKKSCSLIVTYKSKCVDFKGTYTIDLLDTGWGKRMNENEQCVPIPVTEFNYDYSNALGSFSWVNYSNEYYADFTVHKITDNTITFSYHSDWGYDVMVQGDNLTREFDPFSGTFDIFNYDKYPKDKHPDHYGMWVAYDGVEDNWHNGVFNIPRK